jgi:hypothetical protein
VSVARLRQLAARLVQKCALPELVAFLVSEEGRIWIAVFVVQAWGGEAAEPRVEVGQLPVPALLGRLVVVGAVPVPAASRVEEELRQV